MNLSLLVARWPEPSAPRLASGTPAFASRLSPPAPEPSRAPLGHRSATPASATSRRWSVALRVVARSRPPQLGPVSVAPLCLLSSRSPCVPWRLSRGASGCLRQGDCCFLQLEQRLRSGQSRHGRLVDPGFQRFGCLQDRTINFARKAISAPQQTGEECYESQYSGQLGQLVERPTRLAHLHVLALGKLVHVRVLSLGPGQSRGGDSHARLTLSCRSLDLLTVWQTATGKSSGFCRLPKKSPRPRLLMMLTRSPRIPPFRSLGIDARCFPPRVTFRPPLWRPEKSHD